MITICFTHFKSLTLANFAAALYSVRRQDLSEVQAVIVVDNDTNDSPDDLRLVIDQLAFPVPVDLVTCKHGDATRTHSWSTNVAVAAVLTPWVLFTRADYLLSFDLVRRFADEAHKRAYDHVYNWNGFVSSHGCHLANVIEECEQTNWRSAGPSIFTGATFDYTHIDAGVWMARKDAFDRVGGMDENLSAWGHAQTHFQWKMHKAGTEFVVIPETLFWHPFHGAPRDIGLAHAQLRAHGFNIAEIWDRYEGKNPYR